jgi:hypothetical protein
MLWIKRNLFLTVGGLIAIALLAVGILYALGAVNRSSELEEELKQNSSILQRLYGQDPFPATTNVDAANRETTHLRAVVGRMQKYFLPPPVERVTGLAFRTYRDNLLDELRKSARLARTTIPGASYAFSFEEQRARVDFDPRTFPLIPEQMADVRAICNVLFEAHVDPLVNIRRARVSGDDEKSSSQSDYHSLKLMTNGLTAAVISPYEVCFQCLSSDLATVMQRVAISPYGIVVKAVQVEPVEEAQPGGVRQPPRPNPKNVDKSTTVLKERRFQANLLIYMVRAVEEPKRR